MKEPAFSVVMPVYNNRHHIDATIRSVLNQSCADFEFVIVDDGSNDGSLQRLAEWAGSDERIRLVSQANKGASSARNLGISLAKGRYVAFIDADDLWATNKLERHLELHSWESNIAASYAKVAFLSSSDDRSAEETVSCYSTVPSGNLRMAQLIGENPICTMSNFVIHRDILLGYGWFNPSITHAEDQEMFLRIADELVCIVGIDEPLVSYRLNEEGLSSNLSEMKQAWEDNCLSFAEEWERPAAIAIYMRYLARRALRSGADGKVALGYALAGLRSDPGSFFDQKRRGLMTLASSLVAPVLPRPLRMRLFA